MTNFDYDLFVIGGGSGGVRAARIAAGHGARVGLCEESRLGGTCVIRGCVPKKLLVFASQFSEAFEDAAGYGWRVGETSFCWTDMVAAKEREITRLEGVYGKLLANAGVEVYPGRGTLLDEHTVLVGERRISAERILIAVGGRPYRLDIPGAELGIVSDDAFDLPEFPQRVLVVGGGYIAVEFAGIFRGLGSQVMLNYRRERILRNFDGDVRRVVEAGMLSRGIKFHYNNDPLRLPKPMTASAMWIFPTGLRASSILFCSLPEGTPTPGSSDWRMPKSQPGPRASSRSMNTVAPRSKAFSPWATSPTGSL